MNILTLLYIINASILILHEIESAYEKEWTILKLPWGINGFIIFNIPLVLFLFYGAVQIQKQSLLSYIILLISGIAGLIPFIIHEIIVKKIDKFNRITSKLLIYSNLLTGLIIIFMLYCKSSLFPTLLKHQGYI